MDDVMKRISLALLIFFISCIKIFADSSYGVSFSTRMPKTYIILFPEHNYRTPDVLTLSFDMYISQPLSIGQVLMIKYGESSILSLTYIGKDPENCNFVLNPVSDKKKYIEIPFDAGRAVKGNWFTLSIEISLNKRTATVILDDKSYVLSDLNFPETSEYNIFFGPHNAGLSDVIAMAVANVVISENGQVKHVFPLNESKGELAADTLSPVVAEVKFPEWLINKHHYWHHSGTYRAYKTSGITYDAKRNNLIIVDRDSVRLIGMQNSNYASSPIDKSMIGFSGEAVYDSIHDNILFYNMYDGDGITTPFIVKMNRNGKVSDYRTYEFHNPLHHHATVFNEPDNHLYVFGGYGNYSFSDKLLLFNFEREKWDTLSLKGDRIAPRMHTVAGSAGEPGLYYIYGGVGNETGKQELGKEFYSDLYLLNTKTRSGKKIWSHPNEDTYLVPKRNLVYDKKLQKAYVLCSNRNNLKIALYAIDVKTGEHSQVSNETLVNTNCINSTAYLFYNPDVKQFYMAVKQGEDSSDYAAIEVFTLNYPPIHADQLNNNPEITEASVSKLLILSVVIAMLLIASLIYFRLRFIKKQKLAQTEASETKTIDYDLVNDELFETRNNSIYIFGEFTVINRDGINISSRFSSKIKQLFVFVLLNTQRYAEGVSTEKLSLTIWSNKDVSEAKNIRGVTINHLRTLLKELDGISLDYIDEKWILSIEDPCFCDYKETIKLYKQAISLSVIQQLIPILKRGPLLPAFYQYDWFENLKIEFDEFLIGMLEVGQPLMAESKLWNEIILTSNIIFSFDRLNELALQYKLTALVKLGKPEAAQKVYDRFCKEYLICYNEKYGKKIAELFV